MTRCLMIFVLAFLVSAAAVHGKTLVISGRISSEVTVTQQINFGVEQEITEFSYRFPLPAKVASPSITQQVADYRLSFDPQPASLTDETDLFGNNFKVVTWKKLGRDVRATITFTTAIDGILDPLAADAPFPVRKVPEEARLYLKPSKLVQSDDKEIVTKAAELTAGAATQAAAVDAILNFVTDHIRYETPPKSYSALFGLSTGTGNCQNYAHLSCALLRASGIPARVAVGLTLKEKWKIPSGENTYIVQGMGEGLHAWIEVWYPGLGWLPCDPQQSKQFTSSRHIKYAHGPECGEIGITWRSTPVYPRYDSVVTSSFSRDVVDLNLKGSGNDPKAYIVSNEMVVTVAAPVPLPSDDLAKPPVKPPAKPDDPSPPPPVPPVRPPKEIVPKLPEKDQRKDVTKQVLPLPKPTKKIVKPPPMQPDREGAVVFGNMRLPAEVSLYTINGDHGEAALERETAEYVTSTSVYAQSFIIERPVRVNQVSLAMKKFGGDGMVYVDLVGDDNGKPSLSGMRSELVSLEHIRRSPGYGWVDFSVAAGLPALPPGKYWIVLRRSGEAIMNWYYTPGKPYGGPDDTRSTARGWKWEDILPYDFVFKVMGKEVRQ